MSRYKKYRISDTDDFKPGNFPKVMDELTDIKNNIAVTNSAHKEEILISFLKKNSLKPDWIMANPELSSLVSSGVFTTNHLESLFESCHENKQFQRQYEDYIRQSLT